jgi:hypothetical protein
MARNTKAPNTAKSIVWTATSRSEMEGPTNSIVYYMFMMVPADQRQQLLDDLAVWNRENTPEA